MKKVLALAPIVLAVRAILVALLIPRGAGATSKAVFTKPVANPTVTPQPNGK